MAALAFVTAVFLALGITFTVLRPTFSTVTPSGKQFMSVQSSKQNGRVYAVDLSGNIMRLGGGNEYSLNINAAEGGLTGVSTVYGSDLLFCRDAKNYIYVVRDTGESFEFLSVSPSPKTLVTDGILADENHIYIIRTASKDCVIEKYAKDEFVAGEFPAPLSLHENAGTGITESGYSVYDILTRAKDYKVSLAANLRVVGATVKDGYIYIFTSVGRIYKTDTEFSQLAFFESLDVDSAPGKSVTVAGSSFDIEKYYVMEGGEAFSGAAYRASEGMAYVFTTGATLYKVDPSHLTAANSERGKYTFTDKVLRVECETGYGPINQNDGNSSSLEVPSMVMHDPSNTLLLFFTSSGRIYGVNLETGKKLFDEELMYGVKSAAYSEDGEKLYLLSGNVNDKTVNVLSVGDKTVYRQGIYTALLITFFVLAGAALIAFLILLAAVNSRKAAKKIKAVFKDVKKQKFVYLIVIVSLAVLIVFCYYPAVASIALSFTNYTGINPTKQWNNFANYIQIFTDAATLASFKVMLIFLVADIVLSIVPPLIFAFFLSIMRKKRVSMAARILLFLPSVLPSLATIFIWKMGIFGSGGILNTIARFITGDSTLSISFLYSDRWSLPSLIFMGFPWVGSYLIFYGAMMNVPASYFEAAELEGCNIFKRFFKIDIPLIAAQIKYVFVLSFIASVQNFTRVYVTTGGAYGTDVPINRMYYQLLGQNYGVASAYATILFVFLLIATIFNMKMQTVERD